MVGMTLELENLFCCPICKGERIPTVFRPLENVTYSQCQDCGLYFVNPRMSDPQTVTYYKSAYRDHVTEIQHGENGVAESDLKRQRERTGWQMSLCGRLIGNALTHLDIGTSAGYLLEAVDAPVGIGIEPDVRYHDLDPACHYPMFTDISEIEPRQFDLVTMSHVLEHLNHPLEYLQNIIDNYTHANSLILVEVPNMRSNEGAFRIHHPIAFEPRTLEDLFKRLGWQPILKFVHGLGRPFTHYILMVFKRMNG